MSNLQYSLNLCGMALTYKIHLMSPYPCPRVGIIGHRTSIICQSLIVQLGPTDHLIRLVLMQLNLTIQLTLPYSAITQSSANGLWSIRFNAAYWSTDLGTPLTERPIVLTALIPHHIAGPSQKGPEKAEPPLSCC